MARLPALVSALHSTDGRERSTLDLIARTIREAGLIATTKRGSGASEMTVTDAVNLIIGANAVQSPRLAPLAVQQYRTYKQSPEGRHTKGRVYDKLAAADTLADALAVLVEEAGTFDEMCINLIERVYGRPYDPETDSIVKPRMPVLFTPGSVTIMYYDQNGLNSNYLWSFWPDVSLMEQGFYARPDYGTGRRVTTTVLSPTFLALHNALYGKHETAAGSGTGAP